MNWRIDAAFAQRLAILGPDQGTIRIQLPVPASKCTALAHFLDGRCYGTSVMAQTPIELSWSKSFVLSAAPITASRLYAFTGSALELSPSMTFQSVGNGTPALCLTPLSGTSIVIRHRGATQPVATTPMACGDGINLSIGSADAGPSPPAFVLGEVASLDASVEARSAEIGGASGVVVVAPGGSHVLSPPALLQLRADSDPIGAIVKLDAGKPTVEFRGVRVTQATADGDSLMKSRWDTDVQAWQLVIGAIFTLLVLPRLGEVVQALMNPKPIRRGTRRRAS